MRLMHHGGLCCGVKTIYGLSTGPAYEVGRLLEETGGICDGGYTSFGKAWYTSPRPRETAEARMLEYIRYYKSNRTSGILEVVIQTPREPELAYASYGQAKWIPWLLEHGFVEVNAWVNSNSTNVCRQFVLNIGTKVKANPVIPASDWWDHYDPEGKYRA